MRTAFFDLHGRISAERPLDLECVLRVNLSQSGSAAGEFAVFLAGERSSHVEDVLQVTRELLLLALNNAALHRQLLHHSTHDSLTDLPNRRLYEQRFADLIKEAEKNVGTLTVLYLDVNSFKAGNDQYGHKAGDLYLQAIAKRLSGELRPECTVARIGGDEFMILLPHADEVTARFILQRLKNCFARSFRLGSLRRTEVQVSV